MTVLLSQYSLEKNLSGYFWAHSAKSLSEATSFEEDFKRKKIYKCVRPFDSPAFE